MSEYRQHHIIWFTTNHGSEVGVTFDPVPGQLSLSHFADEEGNAESAASLSATCANAFSLLVRSS